LGGARFELRLPANGPETAPAPLSVSGTPT
jgi:hypothetical protein